MILFCQDYLYYCLIFLSSLFVCMFVCVYMGTLQYQQHPDGHGEHSVQWSLHPSHAQRAQRGCGVWEQPCASGGQVSELHMLLGSLPAAVPQQPRPGRTHQSHTCGRTERRGQCLTVRLLYGCAAPKGVLM